MKPKKFSATSLLRVVFNILDGLKMTDIKIYNTSKSSVMFDKVIIATCKNPRQAIAAERDMRKAGIKVICEGKKAQEWFLADCGSVIVHMMLPHIRSYYNLEEIYFGQESETFKSRTKKTNDKNKNIKKTNVTKKAKAKNKLTNRSKNNKNNLQISK